MNRTQHRFLSIVAAGAAAFTVGASPALAGSDGCGGDCQDENAPARVVPAPPTPVTPGASVPAPSVESGSNSPRRSSKQVRGVNRTIANRTVATRRVAQRTTTPRGGVQAGAGGTAPQGPDGALFGIAGAGLVLLAAGGRLVAAGHNARS